MKYLFIVILMTALLFAGNASSQTLTEAEYFFDTDPGQGNGTPLSVTASDCVSVSGLAPLTGLAPGIHQFFLRYRDDSGVWGEPDGRFVYLIEIPGVGYEAKTLTQAECFFNTDPGPGNGTPLSVTESDCVLVSGIIPLAGLDLGFHQFFVRYRDDTGLWGEPDGRFIYIMVPHPAPPEQPFLSGAEYFINYDPGPGNGIALTPEDGVWDELEETVGDTVPGIPAGKHWVGVRFQDDSGNWSIALADSFVVEPILTIQISGTDAILYWQADTSSTIYIYRATSPDGSFSLVDSTTADSSYADIDIISGPSEKQFYQITQSVSRVSSFRLPNHPIEDHSRRKR